MLSEVMIERKRSTWPNIPSDRIVQVLASAFVCAIILLPMGVILQQALSVEGLDGTRELGLGNFARAFQTPVFLNAVTNTIVISTGTTLLASLVGVSLAWFVTRTDLPGRRLLHVCNTIPFYLSPFIGAIAWTYLTAPRVGLLNVAVNSFLGVSANPFNIYSLFGIMWVQGIFFAPVVYIMTCAALQQMDPSLEESSRSCGRGIVYTMLRVTLPLAMPSILSSVILTFVASAGEFGVPLTIGVPRNIETVSTQIFEVLQRAQPDYGMAATLGSLLGAATIVCVLFYRHMILRRNYITLTGKGFRPSTLQLGPWRWLGFALNVVFCLVAVVLPLVALALQSFQNIWLGSFKWSQFTLGNYKYVIFENEVTIRGFENSLILALVGATVGVLLSVIIAQTIYRSRLPGQRFIDVVTSLPVGIPGIVLSMGFLLISLRSPLYGTLVVMLIAYLSRDLPLGLRSVSGVMLSVSPELEEASRSCGAAYSRTFRRVTLPLLKPGLLAGWVLLFVLFLRELPMSILLWKPGTEVTSVALWQLLEHATSGKAAAYAMLQSFVILGVVVIFQFATKTSREK
jgi:iron(III) transport system permease protein